MKEISHEMRLAPVQIISKLSNHLLFLTFHWKNRLYLSWGPSFFFFFFVFLFENPNGPRHTYSCDEGPMDETECIPSCKNRGETIR